MVGINNSNFFSNPNKKFDKQTSMPSFKGHSRKQDDCGKTVYQFFLPTNKEVELEVRIAKENADGSLSLTGGNLATNPKLPSGNGLKIWEIPLADKCKDKRIAYRFKVDGAYRLDSTLTEDIKVGESAEKFNIAIDPNRPVMERPRQMLHIMPDTFKAMYLHDARGRDIRRNHFNKYGGNLRGVIEGIQYINDLGGDRIISTPIFGQDRISDHGYWTTNPYQITDTLGTLADFKELQRKLLNKGMAWVADGAFVNEGIEGIHLRDIARWGEKSPFFDWFAIKGFDLGNLVYGVLPKEVGGEADKYWDIKVINSPLKYSIDENGNPKSDFGQKK